MTNATTTQKFPAINWKTNERGSYYHVDDNGNEWFMTASMGIVSLRPVDFGFYSEWTAQECWNKYQDDKRKRNIGVPTRECVTNVIAPFF